jgi:hypothetical protein
MKLLGNSMVFYLKYRNEFGELCEDRKENDEIPKIAGMNESDVRDLINRLEEISNQADREYNLFRKDVEAVIEKNLSTLFKIEKKSKRDWGIEFIIWPLKTRKPSETLLSIGMDLESENIFRFWIWGRGKRRADVIFAETFNYKSDNIFSWSEIGWENPGNICFKTLEIPVNEDGLRVESDPILNEINDSLKAFPMDKLVIAFEKIKNIK